MKFSNENSSGGVRLSAEPRRPTLKEIREKWDLVARNPSDQSTPINWTLVHTINDILSYIEGLENVPPRYAPEPRLGPQSESEEQAIERGRALGEIVKDAERQLAEAREEDAPPKLCTTSGEPVDVVRANQTEATGQHKGYIVLCEEERAKGFVRPYRDRYKHVGLIPRYPLRDLTPEEHERYADMGYVKFEEYPDGSTGLGRFWTQRELDNHGCGTVTTMGQALSETYARSPGFYGKTFCCGCNVHLPVAEFQWTADGETLGS